MTSVNTAAAHNIEVLSLQARTIQRVVRLNVEGISFEESLIQPQPAGNCLNWVVGHLVVAYQMVLPLLGRTGVFPENKLKRYERHSRPLTNHAEALPLDDLLGAFDEATENLVSGLANLGPGQLDGPAPRSSADDPPETIGALLANILFHQAYHAGQMGLLRRIAGKPGAIS